MQLCSVSHYWQQHEQHNEVSNSKRYFFSIAEVCNELTEYDNNNNKTVDNTNKTETDDIKFTIVRRFISEMKTKANLPLFQESTLYTDYSNTFTQVNLEKLKQYFQQELNVHVFTPLLQVQHNAINDNNDDDDHMNVCTSMESNEHYWRRVAKHFITQAYEQYHIHQSQCLIQKYQHKFNSKNNVPIGDETSNNNVNKADRCNVFPSQYTNFTLAGLHSVGSSDDSDVYPPFTQYASSEDDIHGIECNARNTCNNMAMRSNECAQLNVMGSNDDNNNNNNNNNDACNASCNAINTNEPEDSFYLVDLGVLVRQMARWRAALPMVRPFYAVKCNPSLPILQTLALCGAGFDCASKQEMEFVLRHRLVSDPEKDIIFANPCKQMGDLRSIVTHGYRVRFVTVDSVHEMIKLHRIFPQAKILIRIATQDDHAVCAFSSKFGAPLHDIDAILQAAVKYKLEIYGVSFHVGSGNGDVQAYATALYDAAEVFRRAASYGFNCSLLDIGGGYPGNTSFDMYNNNKNNSECIMFEDIAQVIRPILEKEFHDTIIIAEPGRYFTAASHTLVMNVFGERHVKLSETSAQLIKARLMQEEQTQQTKLNTNSSLCNVD